MVLCFWQINKYFISGTVWFYIIFACGANILYDCFRIYIFLRNKWSSQNIWFSGKILQYMVVSEYMVFWVMLWYTCTRMAPSVYMVFWDKINGHLRLYQWFFWKNFTIYGCRRIYGFPSHFIKYMYGSFRIYGFLRQNKWSSQIISMVFLKMFLPYMVVAEYIIFWVIL